MLQLQYPHTHPALRNRFYRKIQSESERESEDNTDTGTALRTPAKNQREAERESEDKYRATNLVHPCSRLLTSTPKATLFIIALALTLTLIY